MSTGTHTAVRACCSQWKLTVHTVAARTHQHLIGYSLMETALSSMQHISPCWIQTHTFTPSHTHTRPISLLSNGAGPMRMTTRLLRISGHYPPASGLWGQPAAHSHCLSAHICQKQVHTPMPGFLHHHSLSLFTFCVKKRECIVSPPLCPCLQGRKSDLEFFKTILKPPNQLGKYIFLQRTFLPSQQPAFIGLLFSAADFS